MKLLLNLMLLHCFVMFINGEKILCVFPLPARSHFILGNTYAQALLERGHHVTVISPFEENRQLKNYSYRNILLTGYDETGNDIFHYKHTRSKNFFRHIHVVDFRFHKQ